MARFTLPRDIYYGPGAIDELKNLKGYKKAMILTGGSSMKKGGFCRRLKLSCRRSVWKPSFLKASSPIRLLRPSLKAQRLCVNSYLTLSSLLAAVHL